MKRSLAPILLAAALISPLLAAKIPVSGRVVDSAGRGTAGAKVLLLPIPTAAESGKLELAGKTDPEPVITATTDASGAFQLAAPDAGMWKVRIEARGMVPLETVLQPLVDEMELPDASLLPDAGFKVTVTDAAGKPAAGARVRISDVRRAGSWPLPVRLATTGADGTASLPRVADESLTVRVGAAGLPMIERKNVHGATAAFRLAAGQARRLQVRDAKGQGVPGVIVRQGEWTAGQTSAASLLDLDLALPDAGGAGLRLEAEDGRSLNYQMKKAAKPPAPDAPLVPDVATLPAAIPFSGRIVSARDGRPVAGALAWLSSAPGRVVLRTGADGSFRLTAPSDASAFVEGAATGFFAGRVESEGSHRSPTLTLRPRLAATLGLVVDEAGRGLAGAAVTASPRRVKMSMNLDPTAYRSGGFSRSGPAGRFRLASLAPGTPYDLSISLPGFAPSQVDLPAREDGQPAPELRIVMRVGQEAFGRVLDANRTAVAGARVSLRPAAGKDLVAQFQALRDPTANRLEGSSDGTGRFAFSHLLAGTYDLTVQAKGFAPLTVPGLAVPQAKGATDLGTVLLSPGLALEGRVVDAAGQPVEGAEVRATSGQQSLFRLQMVGQELPPDAFTAAGGSFRLEDRAPGESLDLAVVHPGYGPGSAPGVVVPTAEPVRIVLQPTARVSGRTLGKDGKAVAGARVSLSEMTAVSFAGVSRLSPGNFKRAETDEDGTFTFSDVAPGSLELRATAPHLQKAELQGLEVKPGQELTVELVLPPASMVEGRVLAPDGRPVPGAQVSLVNADSAALSFGFSSLSARTDGEGHYVLDSVPLGPRTLEARADGFHRAVRDVEVKEEENTADLTLAKGFEVSGRVVDDAGTPLANVQLMLLAGSGFAGILSDLSGADGAFRFEGVPEGTLSLVAHKAGYVSNSRGDQVTVAGASVAGVEVKLTAGGALTGRITGVEFSQLARVQVAANGFKPGQVDADGTYRIPDVAPGLWKVSASVPGTALYAEGRVTLEPGMAEAKLDLQLGKGFTLTGVVLHNGSPLPGAALTLTHTGTSDSQRAASDHQGAFKLGGLDAGQYELAVRTAGGIFFHKEPLEITGNREVQIDVRSASLAGRVIDAADSSPVAGAQVSLEPADGKDVFSRNLVNTDSHGAFRLAEVAAGAWKLRVSHEGYSPAEKDVQVSAADTADTSDLEILLTPTERG